MPLKLDLVESSRECLDYSTLVIRSKEELERAMDKIPDYRTRPEKVLPEDLQINTSNFSFAVTKAELQVEEWPYFNPIQPPMGTVEMDEMRHVSIDWHMLTTARPATKLDEEIFNRVIGMERSAFKTVAKESSKSSRKSKRNAAPVLYKPTGGKKLGMITSEERHQTCSECGEEFCNGSCGEYQYEIHERLPPVDEDENDGQPQVALTETAADGTKEKTKKGKKGGKKKLSKAAKGGADEQNKQPDEKTKESKGEKQKTTTNGKTPTKSSKADTKSEKKGGCGEKTKIKSSAKANNPKHTKPKSKKNKEGAAGESSEHLLAPVVTTAKLRKRSPCRTKKDKSSVESSDITPDSSQKLSKLKPDLPSDKPSSARSSRSSKATRPKKPQLEQSNGAINSSKAKSPRPAKRQPTDENSRKTDGSPHRQQKSPETVVSRIK